MTVALAGFWVILVVLLGAVISGKPLFSELEVFIKSIGYFIHNYTNKLLKIGSTLIRFVVPHHKNKYYLKVFLWRHCYKKYPYLVGKE